METAMAAIDAGADSVYMGGPAFGARAKAVNSMADLEKAARYAHRYAARCFMTLNTLVYEPEMEEALRLARQAYEAGVDALIIQDLGLLEAGLPPIELHASTQCHIATPQKARFLEKAGFKRLVLARELSVDEIATIAASVDCEIETFVHGALCVSYSGQCYMGCYLSGRSGNRGECSQACRLSYDLTDDRGRILQKSRYLLSMKDLKAEPHLGDLLRAGVSCLKIEGRLKDAAYVKNVTAAYRRSLDVLFRSLDGFGPASQGISRPGFRPDLQKSFHRPYTDFNLRGKRDYWVVPETPKATGERVGRLKRIVAHGNGYGGLCLEAGLDAGVLLSPGDGLCFFDRQGVLQGGALERLESRKDGCLLYLPGMEGFENGIETGSLLYRNQDMAFGKEVRTSLCERKINVGICWDARRQVCRMQDETGLAVEVALESAAGEAARQPEKALETMERQMGKLGGTAYVLDGFRYKGDGICFVPVSALNALRRSLVLKMDVLREETFDPRNRKEPGTPEDTPFSGSASVLQGGTFPADLSRFQGRHTALGNVPEVSVPEKERGYRLNVANSWAARFYRERGIEVRVPAFECLDKENQARAGNVLMVCKHCIRYQIGQCLKENPDPAYQGDLYLCRGRYKFALHFDCQACRMEVRSS